MSNWALGDLGTFSTYTYGYDELGRRTSVENSGQAFNNQTAFNLWGYNAKSELEASRRYTGTYTPTHNQDDERKPERRLYEYDQIGNRQNVTVGDYTTPTLRYCADDLNRYNQTYTGSLQTCPVASPAESFAYDDDGNLTQDGTFNYIWDAENRLIKAMTRIEAGQNPSAYESGDKHVYFTYDYMGRRIRKRVETYNGSSWPETSDQLFVYDGWNIVMVLNANASDVNATAAITRKYTWGLDLSGTIRGAGGIGGLLAAFIPGAEPDDATLWYFYDGNGNVGQVLDATSLQTIGVTARYEYDPYGNLVYSSVGGNGTGNPFQFSTKWFDAETGLGYWGYRFYSSRLGRWLSRDPIEERGGLNVYAMVGNSATNRIDPVGLTTPEQCAAMYLTGQFGTGAEAIEQYQTCLMLAGPYPPSPPDPLPPPTYDVVISGHGCYNSELTGRKLKCKICEDPTFIPDFLGNPECTNKLLSQDVVDAVKAAGALFPTTVWLGHCGAGKMSDSDLRLFAINPRRSDGPLGKPYHAIKRICGCKGLYYYFWIGGYCSGGWKCVDVQ